MYVFCQIMEHINYRIGIWIFWDATLCCWASDSQFFEGTYCLHLQDQAAQEEVFGFFLDCLILDNKHTMILQKSETTHPATQFQKSPTLSNTTARTSSLAQYRILCMHILVMVQ